MLQTLVLCFVSQSPIDRWIRNRQVLIGRIPRWIAVIYRFSSALFGTVETIDRGHMLPGGYVNVIPEVSPRFMCSSRKFPPLLSSCGVVMMGAVPLQTLQTRTLVLDYPMGFSVQMILGLVEAGKSPNES